MQEITIHTVSEYVERLSDINRGRRAVYRGQRRDRSLLPKIIARLTTYLPILQAERKCSKFLNLEVFLCLSSTPIMIGTG
jgi:hypothetical protein